MKTKIIGLVLILLIFAANSFARGNAEFGENDKAQIIEKRIIQNQIYEDDIKIFGKRYFARFCFSPPETHSR